MQQGRKPTPYIKKQFSEEINIPWSTIPKKNVTYYLPTNRGACLS